MSRDGQCITVCSPGIGPDLHFRSISQTECEDGQSPFDEVG